MADDIDGAMPVFLLPRCLEVVDGVRFFSGLGTGIEIGVGS